MDGLVYSNIKDTEYLLLEEQLREGVQVEAPVLPDMGVIAHEEGVGHAQVGQVLVQHEGALVGHLVFLAHADPVELVTGLLDAQQLVVKLFALTDTTA